MESKFWVVYQEDGNKLKNYYLSYEKQSLFDYNCKFDLWKNICIEIFFLNYKMSIVDFIKKRLKQE